MDNQNPVSNGSSNATNNIPEPVVGQNLFPAGSIQTPMVPATNSMPPPVSGSVATDSALHASQFQPPTTNTSSTSTTSTSTTQDATTQPVVTPQLTAETPASGVTFVSTPTNNTSVVPVPVTPSINANSNQIPNVIGNQTNTSGNQLLNANGNQQVNPNGNQLSNVTGHQQTDLGGANSRPNIMVGIAKDQMSALLEEQGLKRGYYPHVARFSTAPIPGPVPR